MSEIKVDTLTGKTTANDITVTVGASATQSLEQGLAKAWLHLDQTATFDAADTEIKESFNITTTLDGGTGRSSWSFVSVFNYLNFSEALTSHQDETRLATSSRSSAGSGCVTQGSGGSVADSNWLQSIEHGDLA